MTFFTYYNKTFEAISYCHKVICCDKKVTASTCLLQYVEFIAMRSCVTYVRVYALKSNLLACYK